MENGKWEMGNRKLGIMIVHEFGEIGLKATPGDSEAADVAKKRLGSEEDEGDDCEDEEFAEADVSKHGE